MLYKSKEGLKHLFETFFYLRFIVKQVLGGAYCRYVSARTIRLALRAFAFSEMLSQRYRKPIYISEVDSIL